MLTSESSSRSWIEMFGGLLTVSQVHNFSFRLINIVEENLPPVLGT